MLLKLCLNKFNFFIKKKMVLYLIYFFANPIHTINTIKLYLKIPIASTTIHIIVFLIFLFQLLKS